MQRHSLLLTILYCSLTVYGAPSRLDKIKPVLFEIEANSRYASTDLKHWELFTRNRVRFTPNLSVEFMGVSATMRLTGQEPTGSQLSLYLGNEPAGWKGQCGGFNAIAYKGLYPGIDLIYRRLEGHLKGDFVVAPGSDVSQIRFRFPGAGVRIEGKVLRVEVAGESLEEQIPAVYEVGGGHQVQADYVQYPDGTIGFSVRGRDNVHPVVIDPDLTFSTQLGGSLLDQVTALTYSSLEGVLLVVGWTESGDFFQANPTTFRGSTDGYFGRFTVGVDGSLTLNSITLFGGTGTDKPLAIAVNQWGTIVVGGSTTSSNFPTVSPFQSIKKGTSDGFIIKFPPYTSTFSYSTYVGGLGTDQITGVGLDLLNATYFAGTTSSVSLPVANALQPVFGGGSTDGFAGKFTSGGSLSYLTYLGGRGADSIAGLAALNGEIYLTGATDSSDYRLKDPYQASAGGGQDAFVTKLNSAGQLAYSTYLGGNGGYTGSPEFGSAIAVNSSGEAYVTGMTSSTNFPVANAAQAQSNFRFGVTDAFLSKFNASGGLAFSTYWGGTSWDQANAITILPSGYVAIGGSTSSLDFPTSGPLGAGPNPSGSYNGAAYQGSYDAFVSVFSPAGVLHWSTYLGGYGSDSVAGLSTNAIGEIFIGGLTGSYNFPKVNNISYQQYPNTSTSGYHGFLAKVGLPREQHGIFRSSTGTFWMVRNEDWLPAVGIGRYYSLDWSNVCPAGTSSNEAIPVVGDWDGTGRQRLGLFRRSTNTWYLDMNGDDLFTPGIDRQVNGFGDGIFFPSDGGYPVVGDWDGTKVTRLGYFQGGLWFLDINGDRAFTYGVDRVVVFGASSDFPIVGDWTKTGRQRLGTYGRAYVVGDGVTWSLDIFGDFAEGRATKFQYGYSTDFPVFADWGTRVQNALVCITPSFAPGRGMPRRVERSVIRRATHTIFLDLQGTFR